MKPSKHNPILKGLLAEDSLEVVRRRSLEQGMAITRHRRRRTNWAKGAIASVLLVATMCLLMPRRQPPFTRDVATGQPTANPTRISAVAAATRNSAVVRFISDEELLALFPGRSLALVGPPGHKELVFLEQESLGDRILTIQSTPE